MRNTDRQLLLMVLGIQYTKTAVKPVTVGNVASKSVQKELMAQEQLKAATAGRTLTDTVTRCSLRTAFSESV